ncbi:MAG: hypothetical protein QOF19_404 [Alphaproteobacteria bacterium]|jgi:hypothetical protein|nr:hypothetical protein [Alphaproteobacteria bacterium]MEA2993105.1 hypothetical protein [Alphaproteobacteria bacterium]
MFRKTILAIAATAALGTAALTPTAASAQWHGGHGGWRGPAHHWSGGPRFGIGFGAPYYAPYYAYAPSCYIVRRVVRTPWGPRSRPVRVCR